MLEGAAGDRLTGPGSSAATAKLEPQLAHPAPSAAEAPLASAEAADEGLGRGPR